MMNPAMKMTIDIVPPDLRRFVGMRPPIDDQVHRAHQMATTLVSELLAGPQTPLGRMLRNGVFLCDATASYLYHPRRRFGFLTRSVRKGVAPLLESHVEQTISSSMTDADKAIALCQSLHQLPLLFGQPPCPLYGESDEQTLLKGGGHASSQARLLVALCQLAGLHARPIIFHSYPDPLDPQLPLGGHTAAEILLDGRWAFFDPACHFYSRSPDGSFHSVIDLRIKPSLIARISTASLRAMNARTDTFGSDPSSFGKDYARRFLQPECPTSVSRHEVNGSFNIRWTWATPEFRVSQQHDHQQFLDALLELAERGGITDTIYRMGVEDVRSALKIDDWKLPTQTGPGDPDPSGATATRRRRSVKSTAAADRLR
jgi:hypothetical protein